MFQLTTTNPSGLIGILFTAMIFEHNNFDLQRGEIMKLSKYLIGAMALACASAVALPAMAREVTADRLNNARAEPENWLMIHGDYLNHRWSRLSQINTSNVNSLRPVFSVAIGGWLHKGSYDPPPVGSYGQVAEESAPLVDDGFMYITDGLYKILKMDVRSGKKAEIVWKFDPEVERHRLSRGVAMINNAVYTATGDMRLLKVDRDSGEAVFDVVTQAYEVENYGTPSQVSQTVSAAPMAYRAASGRELIFVGESSGGSRGTISWCSAWDADTGDMAWRWFSVPFPGEFGHDTWTNENWRTGGGGCWAPPAYDAETNTILAGTGDTWPSYDPAFRPGDNLFTVSTVSLDADTGELVWYFQATPNERWDLDEASPRLVFKAADGLTTMVANFERQGFYYLWDHSDSVMRGRAASDPARGTFISARAYQDPENITWTDGIDPKTGFPLEYDPTQTIQAYKYGHVRDLMGDAPLHCPDWLGGPTALMPPAFNEATRLHYVATTVGCRTQALVEPMDPDKEFVGEQGCCWEGEGDIRGGAIFVMDVDTGERVQKRTLTVASESGLLGTDGGLLFTGHGNGDVTAYDAATLAELWTYSTGANIKSPVITYSVGGNQFVAVLAAGAPFGGALFGQGGGGLVHQSNMLFVFGLGN
jgi:alcohol dehydrogenase (cytochrome c)